jgi:multisubunit Na+/H+ antiporter MnhB subunit
MKLIFIFYGVLEVIIRNCAIKWLLELNACTVLVFFLNFKSIFSSTFYNLILHYYSLTMLVNVILFSEH